MRRLALILTILALAVAIPTMATGATAPKPKTYTVKLGDDFFNPTKRTIHERDIVKWVWVGANGKPGPTVNEHTIVEENDKFQAKTKLKGTYSYRFKKSGTFKVFCAEHPDDMILTVKVKK